MYQAVISSVVADLQGQCITVEVNLANGFPQFTIVGLPDMVVREARERIRSAMVNGGFKFPDRRVTVNLMPSSYRKEGSHLDLPIALGVLCAYQKPVSPRLSALGELSLTGDVVAIPAIVPLLMALKRQGYNHVIIPRANLDEARLMKEMWVYPVSRLSEALRLFVMGDPSSGAVPCTGQMPKIKGDPCTDFSSIVGQGEAKRLLEISAAGGHHVMFVGPPGCGKTMLARALPGILPKLSYEEMMEICEVHGQVMGARPFRSPHYHMSRAALCGGGSIIKPGEVTLSHRGVLYLDEFFEFKQEVLEALRYPMSEGNIHIARVRGSIVLPARFTLVATCNPCPCGYLGDVKKMCKCTSSEIRHYQKRFSGALRDRFDLQADLSRVPFEDLRGNSHGAESSTAVQRRVEAARRIQFERYGDLSHLNGFMSPREVDRYCRLSERSENALRMAYQSKELNLSARSMGQTLKVARTIADLAGKTDIEDMHIFEAINYSRGDGVVG